MVQGGVFSQTGGEPDLLIGAQIVAVPAHQRKQTTILAAGRVEVGYCLSADLRHLEPDPTEQSALAAIRELRRQGRSLRGIAAILNSRGLRTRRGTEWRLESVARVVKQSTLSPLAKIA